MTWKPTEGLRRAESVVQQILADNIACGVPPMTNPTARWRMVKTIAEALDGFRTGAEPEFPLEEREEVIGAPGAGVHITRRNGQWERSTDVPDDFTELRPGSHEAIVEAIVGGVMIDHEAGKPAKRRARGRPRLSAAEKRKRKAAKQAAAVEAEAAT